MISRQRRKIFHGRASTPPGLERARGKCFLLAGVTPKTSRTRNSTTELNVFADFNPKLPAKYVDRIRFLATLRRIFSAASCTSKKAPQSGCPRAHEYWIERTPDDLKELFKHIDILVINDSETRQLIERNTTSFGLPPHLQNGPTALAHQSPVNTARCSSNKNGSSPCAFPPRRAHDPPEPATPSLAAFMGYLGRLRAEERFRRNAAAPWVYGTVNGQLHRGRFVLAVWPAQNQRDTRQGTHILN